METKTSTIKDVIWEEKDSIELPKNLENNQIIAPKNTINETKKNVTKNLWNDIGKLSGIYKIVNKVNGKYYVGSSKNIRCRWNAHKYEFKTQTHDNCYLQRSWNKYGEKNFNFVILEVVPENSLLLTEQQYLDVAKNEKEKCYNLNFIAGKVEMTSEMKNTISNALKKHYLIKENRPMLGRKHTKKSRKKMSLSHIGKHQTKKTKNKISKNNAKNNLGKHLSELTKNKLRQCFIGKSNKKLQEKQNINLKIFQQAKHLLAHNIISERNIIYVKEV